MNGMNIVILGLSITSSQDDGHNGAWRNLIAALTRRGHRVSFLERDKPGQPNSHDLPDLPFCPTHLYRDFDELRTVNRRLVREADLVLVGSRVPEAAKVGAWVMETASGLTAFYDFDTPSTIERMEGGDFEYLEPRLIAGYDLYLSSTGGPTLDRLEHEFGSPAARALYFSVDPTCFHPFDCRPSWDLGCLGSYLPHRLPTLDAMLVRPARKWKGGRFIVAGPNLPTDVDWPKNVDRRERLSPAMRPEFYNRQRFNLNVTRTEKLAAGWSPDIRLFEAAACGTPIITDWWHGLDEFFEPGVEILVALSTPEMIFYLRELGDRERRSIGEAARARAERDHSADARARELERLVAGRDCRRRECPALQQTARA